MINKITTLIGIAIMIAAPVSLFLHPQDITWWDVLGAELAGGVLVYVKDKEFSNFLNEYIRKGK